MRTGEIGLLAEMEKRVPKKYLRPVLTAREVHGGTIFRPVRFESLSRSVRKMLLENGRYYSGGIFESKDTVLWIIIVAGILFTLLNWTLAYFRFKESEIINRM